MKSCEREWTSRCSARSPRRIHEASRNGRRLRDRITVLAHSTKVEINCALDKLTNFFLGLPGCNTAWQIGHISSPGRRPLFVNDEILHQLLLQHQQQRLSFR
jgi:hypothetical protein